MSSKNVSISSSLLRSIDAYLLSDLSRSKGFRSRREVIEEAVRRFLESEDFLSNRRFKHINANGNQAIMYDSLLKRVTTVCVGYSDRIFCDLCSEPDRIHMIHVLLIPKAAKAFAKKGFRPLEHLILAK